MIDKKYIIEVVSTEPIQYYQGQEMNWGFRGERLFTESIYNAYLFENNIDAENELIKIMSDIKDRYYPDRILGIRQIYTFIRGKNI